MALHLKSTGVDFTDFGDATESSELLDDYEEGTWSPTWRTGSYTMTTVVTSATYVKVGRQVTLHYWGTGVYNNDSLTNGADGLYMNDGSGGSLPFAPNNTFHPGNIGPICGEMSVNGAGNNSAQSTGTIVNNAGRVSTFGNCMPDNSSGALINRTIGGWMTYSI